MRVAVRSWQVCAAQSVSARPTMRREPGTCAHAAEHVRLAEALFLATQLDRLLRRPSSVSDAQLRLGRV